MYEGNWREGLRSGDGFQVFEDEAFYWGEWEKGKAHGKGVYWQPDGLQYSGEWKNGMQDGWGTLATQDGTEYTGWFYKSLFLGQYDNNGNEAQPEGDDSAYEN